MGSKPASSVPECPLLQFLPQVPSCPVTLTSSIMDHVCKPPQAPLLLFRMLVPAVVGRLGQAVLTVTQQPEWMSCHYTANSSHSMSETVEERGYICVEGRAGGSSRPDLTDDLVYRSEVDVDLRELRLLAFVGDRSSLSLLYACERPNAPFCRSTYERMGEPIQTRKDVLSGSWAVARLALVCWSSPELGCHSFRCFTGCFGTISLGSC